MISLDTTDKVSTMFSAEHFVTVQLAQCVLSAADCASSFVIELRPSSNVQCSAEDNSHHKNTTAALANTFCTGSTQKGWN